MARSVQDRSNQVFRESISSIDASYFAQVTFPRRWPHQDVVGAPGQGTGLGKRKEPIIRHHLRTRVPKILDTSMTLQLISSLHDVFPSVFAASAPSTMY